MASQDVGLTFQDACSHAKEIKHHSLTPPKAQQIAKCQATFVVPIILVEDVLELLRAEATFIIVCHTVTPVFILVEPCDIDTKERVGQPARACWV